MVLFIDLAGTPFFVSWIMQGTVTYISVGVLAAGVGIWKYLSRAVKKVNDSLSCCRQTRS
jgi:hypothetical protein